MKKCHQVSPSQRHQFRFKWNAICLFSFEIRQFGMLRAPSAWHLFWCYNNQVTCFDQSTHSGRPKSKRRKCAENYCRLNQTRSEWRDTEKGKQWTMLCLGIFLCVVAFNAARQPALWFVGDAFSFLLMFHFFTNSANARRLPTHDMVTFGRCTIWSWYS